MLARGDCWCSCAGSARSRRSPAGVSSAGSRGGRCSASVRMRCSTRFPGHLGSTLRSRCSSRQCRSVWCRWRSHRRSFATGCATSKSSSSAASRTPRFSRPAACCTWPCGKPSASSLPTKPIPTTGSLRRWQRWWWCCSRSLSKKPCRTRSTACSIAIDTTIGVRSSASRAT